MTAATRRSCCSERADDATAARIDVVAIGHPLVDVLAHETDDVVARTGVERGAMTMVDAARSDEIYAQMRPGARRRRADRPPTPRPGVASFGGRAAFIGRIADDTFGKVFAHDLRSVGVRVRRRRPRPTVRRPVAAS